MSRLAQSLPRIAMYAIVICITGIVWALSLGLRERLLLPCSGAGNCTTFLDYSLHDPLCVLDPTCVSPFYRPAQASRSGYAPHWQGLVWLSDPLLVSGNWVSMLAIPNYCLCMLLMVTASLCVMRWSRSIACRRYGLTVVSTWCILEVVGWFLIATALTPDKNVGQAIGTLLFLLLTSLTLLGAVIYINT